MYKDKFVLSVMIDGYPVKETGSSHSRQVAIPFDKEYKLRLKNKHDRACTARVFIDGRKVSARGDVVVGSGETVDLERFIDTSLDRGNKFKFVSLDHPDVDDPSDSNNGIIKVEFRLARKSEIVIDAWPRQPIHPSWMPLNDSSDNRWMYYTDNVTATIDDSGGTFKSLCSSRGMNSSINNLYCSSNVDNGATVEGGHSSQSFSYTNLDVVDNPVILTLKLVGLRKSDKVVSLFKYCSSCGHRMNRKSRYCSECGHRV